LLGTGSAGGSDYAFGLDRRGLRALPLPGVFAVAPRPALFLPACTLAAWAFAKLPLTTRSLRSLALRAALPVAIAPRLFGALPLGALAAFPTLASAAPFALGPLLATVDRRPYGGFP
jgi:hypothetical protein